LRGTHFLHLIQPKSAGDLMKFINFFLVIALCSLAPMAVTAQESASGEVSGKCQYPKQPAVPNGRTATEAELIEAQKNMKAYLAEGNAYIECIMDVEKSWGEEATDEQRAIVVLFNNKVVDDMKAVADLFNAAVRAYKGRK